MGLWECAPGAPTEAAQAARATDRRIVSIEDWAPPDEGGDLTWSFTMAEILPARSAQLYAIIARGIAAAGGVLPDENNKQSSRNTMKSTNSPSNAGRSLGLFLSLVLAGSAYAGPGPQYWQQVRLQHEQSAAVAPTVAPAAVDPKLDCSKCRTQPVQQFSSSNPSGKLSPHSATVGAEHSCKSCDGVITTIKGKTSNQMAGNCPVCAKTSPNCCNMKS